MRTTSAATPARLMLLALLLAVCTVCTAETEAPIVVQNLYYPKPGREQDVLRTRLEASRVRRDLGLAVGRVLVRINEVDGQPYVIWECDYPSVQAREKDASALDQSVAFTKVQETMSGLVLRFERTVSRVQPIPN